MVNSFHFDPAGKLSLEMSTTLTSPRNSHQNWTATWKMSNIIYLQNEWLNMSTRDMGQIYSYLEGFNLENIPPWWNFNVVVNVQQQEWLQGLEKASRRCIRWEDYTSLGRVYFSVQQYFLKHMSRSTHMAV